MKISEMEIWHPFDGKWIHIAQRTKDGIREYYTDGKLITTREVNEDGTIIVL